MRALAALVDGQPYDRVWHPNRVRKATAENDLRGNPALPPSGPTDRDAQATKQGDCGRGRRVAKSVFSKD